LPLRHFQKVRDAWLVIPKTARWTIRSFSSIQRWRQLPKLKEHSRRRHEEENRKERGGMEEGTHAGTVSYLPGERHRAPVHRRVRDLQRAGRLQVQRLRK